MDPEITTLIKILEADEQERAQIIEKLESSGLLIVPTILELLEKPGTTSETARMAVDVLAMIKDPRAFDTLIQFIRSVDPLLAHKAYKAAIKYDREDLALRLVNILPSAHIVVQQSIIVALEKRGDDRVVSKLLDELACTESPSMKCGLLKALGKLGNSDIIPAIVPYKKDSDQHVRDWAAEVLHQLSLEQPQ